MSNRAKLYIWKTLKSNVKEYAFLWNGIEAGWVLVKTPEMPSGYCIYNRIKSTVLHIENEVLNGDLCNMMKQYGCEILNEMPKSVQKDVIVEDT